jgi:hypothetical protein
MMDQIVSHIDFGEHTDMHPPTAIPFLFGQAVHFQLSSSGNLCAGPWSASDWIPRRNHWGRETGEPRLRIFLITKVPWLRILLHVSIKPDINIC